MLRLIYKIFVGLLVSIVNASSHTKCVSLSNQKCMIQPTLIDLHPSEYSQKFHYYPFAVKLDRCVGSCNILSDSSNKVCDLLKTEDSNLSVFNMIIGISKLRTLTKHISCKCKYKFDVRNCNSDQWLNNSKYWCECKKRHVCEKNYVWNPATCNCKDGKDLGSIIDDSAITCDEIIETYEEEESLMKNSSL